MMMKTVMLMMMLQLSHKGYDHLPFFMHSQQMLGKNNLLLPYFSVSFFLPNADFEDNILFDC